MSTSQGEGSAAVAAANNNAQHDVSSIHSNGSHLSTPSNIKGSSEDYDNFDNENKEEENDAPQPVEMPKKSGGAYVGVSLLCAMIAFGGYVFGWDTGTISGFVAQTDFLRRFGSYSHTTGKYYLSNARMGLVVAIFNIGCAIGGLTLGRLGDMYGRKVGLMAVTLVYVIGILIQICSFNKWYQYFIGRIISGLGVGGISVLSPMMIGETAPKHLRGTLVACYQLMITLGIFLGYCTNFGTKNYSNEVQWRVPLGLSFAWALFMVGGMTFVPESSRYLCEKDKIEQARHSIATVNKISIDDPAVQAELDIIMAGVEAERLAGSATIGELFSTKTKVFQRLVMGVMLQSLQQLTGDNYFFYYGTVVFKAVGLPDTFETAIVIGVVNFFSTFVGIWVVGQFGRRTCLLWGAATMTACMVVFASVGVTRLYPHGKSQASSKGAGNCMIVFTCFYLFCFATTWAPLAYVVISESYPLRVKSKCMALATAANWIWGFLISFFTPFITSAIGFCYGYVFMGCLVFMFFYVFFFVPETKGLSLEEVNDMWLEGVLPWKSASWVPASKRGADYDADALQHDEKKGLKRFF